VLSTRGCLVLFALIPPYYLDCVVAIGRRVPVEENGRPVIENGRTKQTWEPIASGFLFGELHGEAPDKRKQYRVYLVSNRHVFKGQQQLVLRFNPQIGGRAKEYELPLFEKGKELWVAPADDELDVAVQPINFDLLQRDGIQVGFFRSDEMAADLSKVRELGITEGDGAFVLGFPLSLVGGERNFVIVRQATIARIRDAIAGVSKEFMLDTLIFPGNSGGPVVLRPEATFIDGTKPQKLSLLVGLVSSFRTYQDVAVSKHTGRPRVVFEENAGLASVIPIDAVRIAIKEGLVRFAPTVEK